MVILPTDVLGRLCHGNIRCTNGPAEQLAAVKMRTMPAAEPVKVNVAVAPVGVKVNHTSLGSAAGEQAGVLMPFWALVVAPTFEPRGGDPLSRVLAPQGSSLPGAVSGVVKRHGADQGAAAIEAAAHLLHVELVRRVGRQAGEGGGLGR